MSEKKDALPVRTWLVQRLHAPRKKMGHPLDNAHRVFGGGNYGISEKLWEALDPIFIVDYMGAAEYEFGTVPTTLKRMYESRAEFTAFSFQLTNKEVKRNDARRYRKDPLPRVNKARTVYVLCPKNFVEGVTAVIREDAQGNLRLKERSHFSEALDPVSDYDQRCLGWFELDNGFFYFIDETMWKKTCELLEVQPEVQEKPRGKKNQGKNKEGA